MLLRLAGEIPDRPLLEASLSDISLQPALEDEWEMLNICSTSSIVQFSSGGHARQDGSVWLPANKAACLHV